MTFFVILYFRHHCKYPPTFVPTHVTDNNIAMPCQMTPNDGVADSNMATNDNKLLLFAIVFYYTMVSTPFIPTPSGPGCLPLASCDCHLQGQHLSNGPPLICQRWIQCATLLPCARGTSKYHGFECNFDNSDETCVPELGLKMCTRGSRGCAPGKL